MLDTVRSPSASHVQHNQAEDASSHGHPYLEALINKIGSFVSNGGMSWVYHRYIQHSKNPISHAIYNGVYAVALEGVLDLGRYCFQTPDDNKDKSERIRWDNVAKDVAWLFVTFVPMLYFSRALSLSLGATHLSAWNWQTVKPTLLSLFGQDAFGVIQPVLIQLVFPGAPDGDEEENSAIPQTQEGEGVLSRAPAVINASPKAVQPEKQQKTRGNGSSLEPTLMNQRMSLAENARIKLRESFTTERLASVKAFEARLFANSSVKSFEMPNCHYLRCLLKRVTSFS